LNAENNKKQYAPGEGFESPLNRVLSEAPYLSRCSDNKTACLIRPREYAFRWPYMQVNRPGMVSWLVFDLDHPNPFIWSDEGLPAPNIVVTNRNNGHSHLFYAIPPVCTTENARARPIAYMKAVYEAMAARLGADPAYSGPVAKTPGHPWWNTLEVHSGVYDLGELADYVNLAVKPLWGKGPNLEGLPHSRHCLLFEELRFYAYSIVSRERDQGNFRSFTGLLEAYAYNKNQFSRAGFSSNLSVAQVKATVKSVARWTWDRYTGSRCHRGVMSLDKSLPLQERQRLAANRTHLLRQQATEQKIRAAEAMLKKNGEPITQMAVVRSTGLSRQTVAKYQSILTQLSQPNPNTSQSEGGFKSDVNVNYAVYQITAVGDELGDRVARLLPDDLSYVKGELAWVDSS
jgi:hypothetical protein